MKQGNLKRNYNHVVNVSESVVTINCLYYSGEVKNKSTNDAEIQVQWSYDEKQKEIIQTKFVITSQQYLATLFLKISEFNQKLKIATLLYMKDGKIIYILRGHHVMILPPITNSKLLQPVVKQRIAAKVGWVCHNTPLLAGMLKDDTLEPIQV